MVLSESKFQLLANTAVEHIHELILKDVENGEGAFFWDALKSVRKKFAPCVAVLRIHFESVKQLRKFCDDKQLPMKRFTFWAVDNSSVDEFFEDCGIEGDTELIRSNIATYLADDALSYQPVFTSLSVGNEGGKGFGDSDAALGMMAHHRFLWWDHCEDVVPAPWVDEEFVRSQFECDEFLDATYFFNRIYVIDQRNPIYAGNNLEIWRDVLTELRYKVIVCPETRHCAMALAD